MAGCHIQKLMTVQFFFFVVVFCFGGGGGGQGGEGFLSAKFGLSHWYCSPLKYFKCESPTSVSDILVFTQTLNVRV